MVAILGTLGFRPETLIPTIKSTEGLTTVVVFHSDHENSKIAVGSIAKLCELMEVDLVNKEIPDAFNFMKVATCILDEISDLRKNDHKIAVFNIAGGTRIMSACALMACTIEGLNAVYVHDDNFNEIPLPLLQIRYEDVLTEVQKKILRHLLINKERDMTQGDLASDLKMHKATVNHHIKSLVKNGAIKLEPKQGDNREKLIKVEESMSLILRP